MQAAAARMRGNGIEAFAFGDLTGLSVHAHKQEQYRSLGTEVLDQLWE